MTRLRASCADVHHPTRRRFRAVMRCVVAVLVTLPGLAFAHVVRARLTPVLASECPAAETVLEALSARGVTVEPGDDWAWRLEAHLEGTSWRAVVDIARPGAPTLHRVLEGTRCAEVVEAGALVSAVFFETQLEEVEPAVQASSPPDEPPRERPLQRRFVAGAGVASGVTATVAPAAAIGFDVEWVQSGWLAALVRFSIAYAAGLTAGTSAPVQIQRPGIDVDLCLLRVDAGAITLRPCVSVASAMLIINRLEGNTAARLSPWVAAGVGVEVSVHLSRRLEVLVGARGLAPLARTTLVDERVIILPPPYVALSALAQLAWSFE